MASHSRIYANQTAPPAHLIFGCTTWWSSRRARCPHAVCFPPGGRSDPKELIDSSPILDDPNAGEVHQDHGGKVFLKLKVAKEDMGRVIGRQGRVANAMRMLLNVAASRHGKQAYLDVEDPQ
jgi:predicted RNA-binding protein YlqC (UPF0109 family)